MSSCPVVPPHGVASSGFRHYHSTMGLRPLRIPRSNDCVILSEKLRGLLQSLQETGQSFSTKLKVVWQWWMVLSPRQADLIPLAIEGDLLDKLLIDR